MEPPTDRTMGPGWVMDAARQPAGLDTRAGCAAGLNALHDRIACRFARGEPRRRALAYLHGLLAPIERKSSCKLAKQAAEAEVREYLGGFGL